MKQALIIGTLVLVSAAIVAVAAQGKSSSTLSFTTKQHAFAQVDVGKKGFSIGDSFVFSEQLIASGKQAGYDHIVCVHSADWPKEGESCTGTVVLKGGTIQLAGMSGEGPFTVVVVGGTGRYTGARGTARIVSKDEKGSIAISLL